MEAMAVETLLAALWELDGYLTKTRVAYKVSNGYSDMDIIGLKKTCLRIGECKARYSPNTVMVITDEIENFYEDWLKSWGKFSINLNYFWDAGYEWLPNRQEIEELELWFCGNIFFQNEEIRKKAERDFINSIYDLLPNGLKSKTSIVLKSTFEVITEVIKLLNEWVEPEDERQSGWGKRFGNPIIDTFRELNRYLNCKHAEGGSSIVKSSAIRSQTFSSFSELFPDAKSK